MKPGSDLRFGVAFDQCMKPGSDLRFGVAFDHCVNAHILPRLFVLG